MLCSHRLHSQLIPLMDLHWSVGPQLRPLCQQHLLHRNLQELCSSLELMDKLQQQNLEKKEKKSAQSCQAVETPSYQLQKDFGENFALVLNTKGFSPEELTVRQSGRKLKVSGKTEKRQEDGKGSYSYSLQEFRQEFDLPVEVNPEDVTCCLSPDGALHIQAARSPCEEAERELTIRRSTEEEREQSVSSHTPEDESSSSSTDSDHSPGPN